jgi:hypothetical protein
MLATIKLTFTTFGDEKYKEWFKPREKKFTSGGGQISVAHYVLSEVKSFNKMLMYSFLKKNNVFIYFNHREGLKHFSAIGVLFGPHPDYSWRQDTIDSVEMTIKAELTPDEKEKLTKNSKAQVIVQLTPQPINNHKFLKVSLVALEVRVPAEHARIYTEVFDCLNERASLLNKGEVDIILDPKVGTFFPYYAKSKRPQLFKRLMRKQNSDMSNSCIRTYQKCKQHNRQRSKWQTTHGLRSHSGTPEHQKNQENCVVGGVRKIFTHYRLIHERSG